MYPKRDLSLDNYPYIAFNCSGVGVCSLAPGTSCLDPKNLERFRA